MGVTGYNATTYIHSSQNLGLIILWFYIFTPDKIWWGGDYMITLYFSANNIWWRGDHIVTLHFHTRQYLAMGLLYRDIIFSLSTIIGEWWLYRDIIFSTPIIFCEGVIILWHYIFTPDHWNGNVFILMKFSSLAALKVVKMTTSSAASDENFVKMTTFSFQWHWIFGEGVIMSWHYIFTPDNISWGSDYIMTLYYHSPRLYREVRNYHRDIIFSFPTIFC